MIQGCLLSSFKKTTANDTAQCIKVYAVKRMPSADRNRTLRLAKAHLHNLRSEKKPLIMLFANFMPNVLTTCRMEEKSPRNATEMKWIWRKVICK